MRFEGFETVGEVEHVALRVFKGGADTDQINVQSFGGNFRGLDHAPSPVTEIVSLDITQAGPEVLGVGDRDIVAAEVLDPDQRTARFLSRRGWDGEENPLYPGDGKLALVTPTIHRSRAVELRFPDAFGSLMLDLDKLDVSRMLGWNVAIHSGTLPCIDLGDTAATALSEYLREANQGISEGPERNVRLFLRDRTQLRLVKEAYRIPDASWEIGGADGTSILVASTSSLDALDGDSEQKDKARVGANLWIAGMEPFTEEEIAAMRVGDATLIAVNGCKRCIATRVNPHSGLHEKKNNFLTALAKSGQNGISQVTNEKGPYFGVGFAPLRGAFVPTIKKGDPVEVIWRATPIVDTGLRRKKLAASVSV